MTGLFNRWYMEEQLKHYELNSGERCALIMGDLNGLKLINDAFGHSTGDHFIQKIADILKDCTGENGVVGRWGGDEFLILIPDAGANEAEELIRAIQTRCTDESDEQIQLSIALGYALKTGDEDEIHSALRAAEQLTYRRKLTIEKSFRSSVINALLSHAGGQERRDGGTRRAPAPALRPGRSDHRHFYQGAGRHDALCHAA